MAAAYCTSELAMQIRSETYCDDIDIPDAAARWTEAEVRDFFESGGVARPEREAAAAPKEDAGEGDGREKERLAEHPSEIAADNVAAEPVQAEGRHKAAIAAPTRAAGAENVGEAAAPQRKARPETALREVRAASAQATVGRASSGRAAQIAEAKAKAAPAGAKVVVAAPAEVPIPSARSKAAGEAAEAAGVAAAASLPAPPTRGPEDGELRAPAAEVAEPPPATKRKPFARPSTIGVVVGLAASILIAHLRCA